MGTTQLQLGTTQLSSICIHRSRNEKPPKCTGVSIYPRSLRGDRSLKSRQEALEPRLKELRSITQPPQRLLAWDGVRNGIEDRGGTAALCQAIPALMNVYKSSFPPFFPSSFGSSVPREVSRNGTWRATGGKPNSRACQRPVEGPWRVQPHRGALGASRLSTGFLGASTGLLGPGVGPGSVLEPFSEGARRS